MLIYQSFAVITKMFVNVILLRGYFHNIMSHMPLLNFLLLLFFIMASLCGVRIRIHVNNFFSKTTRSRDMLVFLKDTLTVEDDKSSNSC